MWLLFKGFAGMRVVVPKKMPDLQHALCVELGEDGCRRLVASFGGEVINVPVCDAAKRRLRDESIRDLIATGVTVNDLANRFGLTYRQVQAIARGVAGPEVQVIVNFDLFD